MRRLRAVEPLAIEAIFEAERMHRERQEDQRHIHDLEHIAASLIEWACPRGKEKPGPHTASLP